MVSHKTEPKHIVYEQLVDKEIMSSIDQWSADMDRREIYITYTGSEAHDMAAV